MSADAFKDVPEFFEVEIGESLTARTETLSSFRELGPPDLCHVVKSTGKAGQKDIGTYHYVSGVDASSSASLAAYLNSLTYAVEDTSTWFTKVPAWKVRNGCYCCFNAFSRLDMRVDVKIPGGVQAYVVDLRGERREATPELWQETYLSALLRAILYADDPNYRLIGYRKLDPITTREGEIRFLETAEILFSRGWQLGSDPEIQVASLVSNHLTAGLMKYFGDSFRLGHAANLFEKLILNEPEVASLLVQSYLGMNEEVKAVQIMAAAIRDNPQSYTLLHAQCDFLRNKGKHQWALELAKQAVNCAPSEFVTWAKLAEVYIELKEYDSALLTLNSCPMFTYSERDLHRMPTPAKTNLPIKQFIKDSQILEGEGIDEDTDPALLRLPAPALRGTFAKAYALLAKLSSAIGWDELLKTRALVFVMEEEYRMHKSKPSQEDIPTNGVINEDGTVSEKKGGSSDEDDGASTRALRSPVEPPATEEDESSTNAASSTAIPTIRISSESTRQPLNGTDGEINGLRKPAQVAEKPEGEEEGEPADSFRNKRLCERWLDNMFMCLYEDLRIWTIFRAEVAHFKNRHQAYRKTGTEWEILGDLGTRLNHKEEAKEAYQRCLEAKFSSKAWLRLLEIYADEGDLQKTLNAAIRLTAYQHRWYMEMAYPTAVSHHIYKLGLVHGHAKISFTVLSMGLPDGIRKIVENYLQYGKTFQVEGHDF